MYFEGNVYQKKTKQRNKKNILPWLVVNNQIITINNM